jgi:BspA type Leucine rich repeat region (6 copies)
MKTKCHLLQSCLLGALLLALPAVMQGQLTFTTNNGAITITGYTGNPTSLDIPSMTNGLPVTSIGDYAFFDCTSLTSVTIGTNVTSIGDSAFFWCTSLTNITIPNSVITIGDTNDAWGVFRCCFSLASVTIGSSVASLGDWAFRYCSSLTSVRIPNSVTSIGEGAFGCCDSLTAITVDTRNSFYSDLDGVLFNQNLTTLVQYPGGIAGAYTVPNSVTSIGDSAFVGCSRLTGVCFEGSAPTFGANVFSYLQEGEFGPRWVWDPATVFFLPGTTGWSNSFAGLPAFLWDPLSQAGYSITNGTVTITGYTGSGGAWTIPSTISGLPVTSIGSCLCASLINVTIPSTVTNVAGGAFSGCTSLTAITVETNDAAYSSLDGVLFDKSQTTLIECPDGKAGAYTIPNSVTNIGSSAFSGCTSLTTITIPDSVTNIDDYAFSNCTSLTTVMIGNSVTNIGYGAFQGCSGLTSVTIPNSVTSVADSMFLSCSSLTNVTIGNSVAYIGAYAFAWCYSLTSVTISDSVTNIGAHAFFDCWVSLASVTIPNSVTSIGDSAFSCCTSLIGVNFLGNAPGLGGSSVFTVDPSATIYYLPGTTGWGSTFGGLPTMLWNPSFETTNSTFGVQNNQFGFTISGTANIPLAIEACTNLASASWTSLQTCTLTNGSIYFSDPQWTNYARRFYRLRSP